MQSSRDIDSNSSQAMPSQIRFRLIRLASIASLLPLGMVGKNVAAITNNDYPSFQEIIKGLENCEVQLSHDGLPSSFFHSSNDADFMHVPIVLVFVTRSNKKKNAEIITTYQLGKRDPSRVKGLYCRINFLVPINIIGDYNIGDEYYLWIFWDHRCCFYSHKSNPNIGMNPTDFYVILITNLTKSGVALFIDSNMFMDSYGRNFGIIFFTGRYDTGSLCIHRYDKLDKRQKVVDMVCRRVTTNVVDLLEQLNSPASIWSIDTSRIPTIPVDGKNPIIFKPGLMKPRNPFNRNEPGSSFDQMIQIIFQRANATVYKYKVSWISPYFQFGKFGQDPTVFITPIEFLVKGVNGFKFLTCHFERYISFHLYVKPFQMELWVTLIVFIISLTILTKIYIRWGYFCPTFSPWLFMAASLVEKTCPVPADFEKKYFFRLVLGWWVFMSLTLTNCYHSLLISELNSPFPAKMPKLFQDLLCDGGRQTVQRYWQLRQSEKVGEMEAWLNQTILSRHKGPWMNNLVKRLSAQNPYTQKCFSLLSQPTDTTYTFSFVDYLINRYIYFTKNELIDEISLGTILLYKMFDSDLELSRNMFP